MPDNSKGFSPDWYTVEDGKQAGPWPLDQVRGRIQRGELPADTLVWSEGMSDWLPAGAVPQLTVPPAIVAQPQTEGFGPYPWHRWFARLIDVSVAGAILGFAAGALGQEALFENTLVGGFVAIIFLIFVVEPLSMVFFGKTVGKSMLNISVTKTDSTRLDFPSALSRSVSVWIRGLGLGIPLVSLFTMNHQYNALRKKGAATYDENRFRVTHGVITSGRKLALFLMVLILFALIWIGSAVPSTPG